MSILQASYRRAQGLFFSPNQIVRWLALGGLLAAGALLIALFVGVAGPLPALAAAAALIAGVLILADTHWGFVALCAVVFIVPFASLPFSIGFKPTFLDAALGALFFVWLFKLVIGQDQDSSDQDDRYHQRQQRASNAHKEGNRSRTQEQRACQHEPTCGRVLGKK